VREIEWTEAVLEDMAGLDKGIARRVKQVVERFAERSDAGAHSRHRLDAFLRAAPFSGLAGW
jgi:hypothetical protein